MTIWYWALIAHTAIWGLGAILANLFSPKSWSESTMSEKFNGFLTAELQLFKALVTIWVVRHRLFAVWSKKWRERKSKA